LDRHIDAADVHCTATADAADVRDQLSIARRSFK
jgi:hypothetical protein